MYGKGMSRNPAKPLDPVRSRLLELARERRVSLASLSEMLGRNPSYLQQFIRKRSPRKLEEGDRQMLAEFFGIAESELREDSSGVREKSLAAPLSRAAPLPLSSPDGAAFVDIPRLAIGASAGPGALTAAEAAFDTIRFSRRWLAEQGFEARQLSAIRVEGDSMEPLLNDGDEILVDRTPRPFRDGIHVVRLGDSLMVKRVASAGAERFSLLSQNLAYPPVIVPMEDVEIIGRVVWKGGLI